MADRGEARGQEIEQGAHVIARLHDNWLIQPLRDAIASESIDGMSFRFEVVRAPANPLTMNSRSAASRIACSLFRIGFSPILPLFNILI